MSTYQSFAIRALVVLGLALTLVAPPAGAAQKGRTSELLAVSWQPAFCETRPRKTECRNQSEDRFDASHFTLHGLWPMRQNYCGVAAEDIQADERSRWSELPEVTLSAQTREALNRVMPGTRSDLDRHEWIKHGTCSGMSQEAYFRHAIALLEDLNRSAVQTLFSSRIGQQVTRDEVQAAFDKSFGEGAGNRVRMHCDRDGNRRIITELTIGLGDADRDDGSLAERIQAAGTTRFECEAGTVDAVGLQ